MAHSSGRSRSPTGPRPGAGRRGRHDLCGQQDRTTSRFPLRRDACKASRLTDPRAFGGRHELYPCHRGRPNVGKSTLFNRLVGRKLALVDDQPGVTRDLREGDARIFDLRFTVIDTAGLEEVTDDSLQGRMRRSDRTRRRNGRCLPVPDRRPRRRHPDRPGVRRHPAQQERPGVPWREQGRGQGGRCRRY